MEKLLLLVLLVPFLGSMADEVDPTRLPLLCNDTCTCNVRGVFADVDCKNRNITELPEVLDLALLPRRLDISFNKLSHLPHGQFSRWGNLEELSLARNQISRLFPGTLAGLAALRVLDLSHNKVFALPEGFLDEVPNLEVLLLVDNHLEKIPAKLPHHLTVLSLSHNTDLGHFLQKLEVRLETPELTTLYLDNIGLSTLPQILLQGSPKLQELSLADNYLTEVPILPASLEVLDLSGIDVKTLMPGSFLFTPHLRELSLNRLMALKNAQEETFAGLSKLRKLSMENCISLSEVSSRVFKHGPQSLEKLSMAHGNLRFLHSDVLRDLPQLTHVDLQGNPWHCDCRLSWLIAEFNHTLQDNGFLRCSSPPHVHDLRLREVDLVCFKRSHLALRILLYTMMVLAGAMIAFGILIFFWKTGLAMPLFAPYRRLRVGIYSHITGKKNTNDEMEWDNKDLTWIRA